MCDPGLNPGLGGARVGREEGGVVVTVYIPVKYIIRQLTKYDTDLVSFFLLK